ncbi:MAG TPA: ABC transporter permease [Terriglobales bacterium]|nr:ABC transporter permease [Terriglobales bacterium]
MSGLLQDLRHALRQMRQSPGFTSIVLLMIAIGVAANTSVFIFTDALFLRSVPAKDPARLVRVRAPENDGEGLLSYPEYAYLRDHAKTLESLAAHYSTAPLYVTANGEAGEVEGAVVSSNYFTLLGLKPYLGRFFSAEEDSVPDRDTVTVVGYGFWKRTYDGDPNVLGRMLTINGHAFEIVGVMPPQFRGVEIGGTPNEIWIPTMTLRVGYRWCDGFAPSCTILGLMGRLAAGRSAPEAQAEIAVLLRQLQTNARGFDQRLSASVVPAIGISNGKYFRVFVQLLTAIGGVLLLIVCANVGGLLLVRGKARAQELAMRAALGANRLRIVRQLVTENLVLAFSGGALGVAISVWSSRLLAGFYSVDGEGYRHLFDLRLDVSVLTYSILIIVVAGLLFGLLSSWPTSRPDLQPALKGVGGHQPSSGNRTRTALITAQVALSLALLVGGGLMAQSAARIEARTDMNLSHVVGLRLRPKLMEYSPAKAQAFTRDVLLRLGSLPVVESVSLAKEQGLVWRVTETIRERMPAETYAKPEEEPLVGYKPIAPAYFRTLGIPLMAGRDFSDKDRPETPPVAMVNETLAQKLSAGRLPLDRTILLDEKPYQIVGIVKDAQTPSAVEAARPVAYVSFWQDPSMVGSRLSIRVAGSEAAALPLIRKAIAGVDPNVPVTEVMPLMEQVRGVYTDARVASAVLICAALIGLLLSALGLYGVVAYEVSQRRQEIGIRMALGAHPSEVVQLFLKQACSVILAGLAAGSVLTLLTTRLLATWLFGVRPSDPATLAAAMLVLLTVALLASYIPARGAAKVDPMVTLRSE